MSIAKRLKDAVKRKPWRQSESVRIESNANNSWDVRVEGREHEYKGVGGTWLDADNAVGEDGQLAFVQGIPYLPIFFSRGSRPLAAFVGGSPPATPFWWPTWGAGPGRAWIGSAGIVWVDWSEDPANIEPENSSDWYAYSGMSDPLYYYGAIAYNDYLYISEYGEVNNLVRHDLAFPEDPPYIATDIGVNLGVILPPEVLDEEGAVVLAGDLIFTLEAQEEASVSSPESWYYWRICSYSLGLELQDTSVGVVETADRLGLDAEEIPEFAVVSEGDNEWVLLGTDPSEEGDWGLLLVRENVRIYPQHLAYTDEYAVSVAMAVVDDDPEGADSKAVMVRASRETLTMEAAVMEAAPLPPWLAEVVGTWEGRLRSQELDVYANRTGAGELFDPSVDQEPG